MTTLARGPALVALLTALALAACVDTGSDNPDGGQVPDVSYQGSRDATDIEGANATALGAGALGLSDSIDTLTLLLAQENPGINTGAALPLISVMAECEDGGKRTITQDGDTTTVEYFDCVESGVTVDGRATRRGSADDHTTTVAGIRLSADGLDLSFAGSFSYRDSGDRERLALHELIVVDNTGTRSVRAENLVLTDTDVDDGRELTVDGRLFDSELGYVDVATDEFDPLFVATGDNGLASSGRLTLTGQANESIVIMPISSATVNLQIDSNGDNVDEIDETITWSEFFNRVGLPTL